MTVREFDALFQRYVDGSLSGDDAAALKDALLDERWQRRWVELSDIEGLLADELSVESEEAIRHAVAASDETRHDSTRLIRRESPREGTRITKRIVLTKTRRASERVVSRHTPLRGETRVTKRVVVEGEALSRPVRVLMVAAASSLAAAAVLVAGLILSHGPEGGRFIYVDTPPPGTVPIDQPAPAARRARPERVAAARVPSDRRPHVARPERMQPPPERVARVAPARAGTHVRPADETAAGDAVASTPATVETVAYLDTCEGDVYVSSRGDAWSNAEVGTPLRQGEALRTRQGCARVCFESGTNVYVNRFTSVSFDPARAIAMTLADGELYIEVSPGDTGFTVDTPHGTTTDIGTAFDVLVKPVTGTSVVVVSGTVEAATDIGTVMVTERHESSLSSRVAAPSTPRRVADLSARLGWAYAMSGTGDEKRVDLTAGLVAYWPFDERRGRYALDHSGNGHTGTVEGATWIRGRMGSALYFDHLHDGVSFRAHEAFRITSAITIAAWVKFDKLASPIRIAGTLAPGNGYRLRVLQRKADFAIVDAQGKHVAVTGRAGTVLEPGIWYHIAGTYSDERDYLRTYVNGRLDRQTRTPAVLAPVSNLFAIGRGAHPNKHTVRWPGGLDDVVLYNRALNAEEVKALYARAER